ncbi:MAG: GDP-mannose 4,6-dehydratase [Isosphaeraceae bacterium]|jgi:GDP-4-dehydro-6-deoxy-D-mannose reductase|nr:MAG: GDP-mannose 4,6-dehydratase [Isosphaeraceae bacterium]
MRALVTGATGFVAAHLIRHLVDSGDQVIGLSQSGHWPDPASDLPRICRLEPLDLTNTPDDQFADLLRRKQPEAIYHLAAQSNPRLSLDNPRLTWSLNLGGTFNLLEAIRHAQLQPRVILVSSGVVYGNPEPHHLPVREDCPVLPNNPYAASKAAADILGIQHALTYHTPTIIARPFNHAGPGQSDLYVLSSLARQVAEVEAGLRPAVSHGNLAIVRDFTDVRDIVRAYRLLATSGQPGQIYNIGSGRDLPLQALFDTLRNLAHRPIPSQLDPNLVRPIDQPRLLADSSKLHAHTGWSPTIPLETTLADMLNTWRRQLSSR